MTEQEWSCFDDSEAVLKQMRQMLGSRKVRLLAVAWCYRLWELLDDRSRNGVEAAEQYADGRIDPESFQETLDAAKDAWIGAVDLASQIEDERGFGDDRANAAIHATDAAYRVMWNDADEVSIDGEVECVQYVMSRMMDATFLQNKTRVDIASRMNLDSWTEHTDSEWEIVSTIIRDLGGNPFRPVVINPTWLAWNNSTVPKFAQAAYHDRQLPAGHLDTARLATLADALEEAGCDIKDILDHLRGPGPHVRGCWAVDLILGRE